MVNSGVNFHTFAQSQGLTLLKDDTIFLKGFVSLIPWDERKFVLQKYVEIWLKEMSTCAIFYKRQNVGRRAANNFLREFVDGNGKSKMV
jgi:hypothetical protein